ncbi:MAG TPA: M15 family metallopeptidase [Noviherbaspirillum sp.]|nr:M15 family metallopeptidase [Noviherbaspirillum sp.]
MLPHEKDNNLALLLASLGISDALLASKALPFYPDARELALAETGSDGRDHLMIPAAAAAWQAMKEAARNDGIVLEVVSAFRDVEEQTQIIRDKQARGMAMEAILTLSAPPGYSEHHTGRAVDINTPGCEAREEPFEDTHAFRWLVEYAGRFGFVLSYPRGNALGFIYEPWHWFYQPGAQA